MDDHPYTTPDEDPFNVRPIAQQMKSIKYRRPSMLDKWIMEQQQSPTEYHDALHRPGPCFSTSDASSSASFSNPYLAYPDLPRVPPIDTTADKDTASSINSYDFVNDDDIPPKFTVARDDAVPQDHPIPFPARATKTFKQSFSPAFRHINLPFRSPTPSKADASSSYRTLSRLSIFQRTPRSSTGISSDNYNTHSRTPSVLTHDRNTSQHSANSNVNLHSPRTNSKWRPSVLGHFYQPSVSQSSVVISEALSTPSRPSISSDTFSTSRTATTIESNVLSTPPKLPAQDPLGYTPPTTLSSLPTASRSSIWLPGHGLDSNSRGAHYQTLSQHRTTYTPELNENDDDPLSFRAKHHDTIRASIPYSSTGTLPRVKFSSLHTRSHRKKKKLVISGVGVGDTQKFEGIKRWCESFGQVRQIARMPNGDLHIDFRDSEVADTVCRVRARVHIAGVGSVQLSWFAGHKR